MEAFTGLFTNFSWAIAQGKGLVPRSSVKMMKPLAFDAAWRHVFLHFFHFSFLALEDSRDFGRPQLFLSWCSFFFLIFKPHLRLGRLCCLGDFRRRLHDVAVSFDAHLYLAALHLACATCGQRRGAEDLGRCGPIVLLLAFGFWDPGHGNNEAALEKMVVLSQQKKTKHKFRHRSTVFCCMRFLRILHFQWHGSTTGLPHHVADTALVTAWSWWSLLAVSVTWRCW